MFWVKFSPSSANAYITHGSGDPPQPGGDEGVKVFEGSAPPDIATEWNPTTMHVRTTSQRAADGLLAKDPAQWLPADVATAIRIMLRWLRDKGAGPVN